MLIENMVFSRLDKNPDFGGGVVFRDCRFEGLDYPNISSEDTIYIDCTICDCKFYGYAFISTSFFKCEFSNVHFENVVFMDCDFIKCNFTNSEISQGESPESMLQNTKFFACNKSNSLGFNFTNGL